MPGLRTITIERRVRRSRIEIVTIADAGRDFAGELRKRK
jgi:hypothetical protein